MHTMDWAQSLYKPCRVSPRSSEEEREKSGVHLFIPANVFLCVHSRPKPNDEHTPAHIF